MRALAAGLVGAALLVTAAPIAAADAKHEGQLVVTAAASPAWLSGRAMPLRYVVRNTEVQLGCDKLHVTLTWTQGGPTRSVLDTQPASAGVHSGSLQLPPLVKGTVRYRLTASQYCGFFDLGQQYVGATSWLTATVV